MGFSGTVEDEVCVCINWIADRRNIVTTHAMLSVVVNTRVVMTDNSYHHFVLWGDGEGARQIGYIVVALHIISGRRNGIGANYLAILSV